MVKRRLGQCSRKQRIVAIDAQSPREGKLAEELEFYKPRREDTQLDILAIDGLCRSGAKLTETARNILGRAKSKIT
uniref:ribosomal protein S16 n=1 Tax=Adiantum malesianum TaxID=451080 RepID=UPI00201D6BC7|nr:ribosomal protein S16 [Adiantum malesianum]UPV69501.1 ribosomal protein S16 [Adiantum malesianum]